MNMMIDNEVIKVKNLYKSFGDKQVLDGVSFSVLKGECYVLIGKSGAGKSVLMKHLAGIMYPDSGEIYLNGINVTNIPKHQRLKMDLSVGVLFQSSALFDSLTVQKNITFPVDLKQKLSNTQGAKLATKYLEMVGLQSNILGLYPEELSGGMQKRLAFARLLAMQPKIVLYDEPTTGLDPIMSHLISDLIITTNEYLHATSFVITHDMLSANMIADKMVMLHDAKLIHEGSPQDFRLSDNQIVKSFLDGYRLNTTV